MDSNRSSINSTKELLHQNEQQQYLDSKSLYGTQPSENPFQEKYENAPPPTTMQQETELNSTKSASQDWSVFDPESALDIPVEQSQVYQVLADRQDEHTSLVLFFIGFLLLPIAWFSCWKKFQKAHSAQARKNAKRSKKALVIFSLITSTLILLIVAAGILTGILVPILDD